MMPIPPLRWFRVVAKVEVDERCWEVHSYRVCATSKTDAERRLRALFFAEHPHDLCKKGHRHVGLDRVYRGKTEEIRIPKPKLGDIIAEGELLR